MKKIILSLFLFTFLLGSMPALAASPSAAEIKALKAKLTQIRKQQLSTKAKIQKNKTEVKKTIKKVKAERKVIKAKRTPAKAPKTAPKY